METAEDPLAPAPIAAPPWAQRHTAGLIIAGLLVGGLLVAVGLLGLGLRAGSGHARQAPAPDVVGLPLAQARRALERQGATRITVIHAPYGAYGVVLKMTGYEFDGTISPDSQLQLLVGTTHLKPWSTSRVP